MSILCFHPRLFCNVFRFVPLALCILETNAKCCRNFVKFMMFDFFGYVLANYEQYIFFEWVWPHLVRVKSLRLMEFFTNIVWIETG